MKQIRVNGKYIGDQFKVENFQQIQGGGEFNDWNTIYNAFRLIRKSQRQRGFTYTFPLIFGE